MPRKQSSASFWSVCACLCAELLQLCLTLCDFMDCSLPDFSVHGILQTRILEWVTMPSSRRSSWLRDLNHISYIYLHWQVGSLPLEPPGKPTFWSSLWHLNMDHLIPVSSWSQILLSVKGTGLLSLRWPGAVVFHLSCFILFCSLHHLSNHNGTRPLLLDSPNKAWQTLLLYVLLENPNGPGQPAEDESRDRIPGWSIFSWVQCLRLAPHRRGGSLAKPL